MTALRKVSNERIFILGGYTYICKTLQSYDKMFTTLLKVFRNQSLFQVGKKFNVIKVIFEKCFSPILIIFEQSNKLESRIYLCNQNYF